MRPASHGRFICGFYGDVVSKEVLDETQVRTDRPRRLRRHCRLGRVRHRVGRRRRAASHGLQPGEGHRGSPRPHRRRHRHRDRDRRRRLGLQRRGPARRRKPGRGEPRRRLPGHRPGKTTTTGPATRKVPGTTTDPMRARLLLALALLLLLAPAACGGGEEQGDAAQTGHRSGRDGPSAPAGQRAGRPRPGRLRDGDRQPLLADGAGEHVGLPRDRRAREPSNASR